MAVEDVALMWSILDYSALSQTTNTNTFVSPELLSEMKLHGPTLSPLTVASPGTDGHLDGNDYPLVSESPRYTSYSFDQADLRHDLQLQAAVGPSAPGLASMFRYRSPGNGTVPSMDDWFTGSQWQGQL